MICTLQFALRYYPPNSRAIGYHDTIGNLIGPTAE